jgi:hypothetical protein
MFMIEDAFAGPVGTEFEGAVLGDRRRTERLTEIAQALELDPALSFPRAMASDAALEAFYRFINNDRFGAADILAPHFSATLARASEVGSVIAVHDTTLVEYGTERNGLGVTRARGEISTDSWPTWGCCYLKQMVCPWG